MQVLYAKLAIPARNVTFQATQRGVGYVYDLKLCIGDTNLV